MTTEKLIKTIGGSIDMTTMTQAEIREVAESLIGASPTKIALTKGLILSMPNGEELHKAISEELVNIARENLLDSLDEAFGGTLMELLVGTEEEENQFLERKELSDAIAKQVEEQKLSRLIHEQVFTPEVNLSTFIKSQVESQTVASLVDEIAEQLKHEAEKEEATNLCHQVVNMIFERKMIDLDNHFSLCSEDIALYARVFKELFDEVASGNGYDTTEYEYKNEYTAIILTELVSNLVAGGAELSFEADSEGIRTVLTL